MSRVNQVASASLSLVDRSVCRLSDTFTGANYAAVNEYADLFMRKYKKSAMCMSIANDYDGMDCSGEDSGKQLFRMTTCWTGYEKMKRVI